MLVTCNNIHNFTVISDVHLRDPHDELTEKFISTLNSIGKTDTLFLLGDIFDFIAASSPFFFKLWDNVFFTFRQLKRQGIKVYFIEGNHDFGFEHFKSDFLNSCFTEYGDFIAEFDHPLLGHVRLQHGDNVVCKKNYLAFRLLVKNKWFQKLASLVCPGFFMHIIFSRYAKLSRKKDQYRRLEDDFLHVCLQKEFKKNSSPRVFIIGHIHVLKDETINHHTRFLSGPDWPTSPSYLAYDDKNGLHRVFVP